MTSISENSQKKTYVIGITGSIGCGKSLVGRQLQELGVAVIDADHLSHELVNNPGPAYDKILARFGADLAISPGGPIDRKKLGAIVFADSAARTDLEAILHPAIGELQKTRTIELAKTHDIVAVLVPLLFETGSRAKYSAVWAVVVHKEIQIQRLKLRDKLSDEEVVRRIKAQWPQDKKAELADHVIDNSGAPDQTMERVKFLVGEIRTKMGLPQGQTPKPDHAPAPTDGAPAPTDGAPAPTDGAPAPTDGAPAPTDGAPAPTDGAPAPTDGAPAPTDGAPAPTDGAPAPTDGAPAPTDGAPAPTDGAPAPTDGAPAPTDGAPAPTDGAPAPTDGAPAPTDGAPAPTDGAPAPTDGAPAPTDGAPAPTDDSAANEATNQRNRAALKQLGEIAAEEALEKLGDIGTTSHREATASMTMAVKAGTGSKTDTNAAANTAAGTTAGNAPGGTNAPANKPVSQPEIERELQVDVRMSVRNRPGKADPDPVPVPTPTPTPVPAPVPTPAPCNHGSKSNHLPIVACLLAFLAFLAFLLVWSYDDTPVVVKSDPTPVVVTVNNNGGCCSVPVVTPTDPVKPPVVVDPKPVDPPTTTGGTCKAGVETLSEPPAFTLSYLHNQVRWRVVKWTVTTDGAALNGISCLHTTVEGRDAEGRLVVRQLYGAQLAYQGQYTITYTADCMTQVDRFNENNAFIGRSFYRTNEDGKLVQAIQLDSNQRKLFAVTIELARDGSLYAVSYQSFAAAGQPRTGYFEKVSQYRDFLTANFYLAELALN